MLHNPAPIEDRIKSIEDLGTAAGRANRVDELPASIAQAWGMIAPELFEDLREANDVPERREQFSRELREAFSPVLKEGILSPTPLPRIDQNATQFAIRLEGQDDSRSRLVTRDHVSPERLGRPDSDFGKHFVSSFRPPELGRRLFELIDDKLAASPATCSWNKASRLTLKPLTCFDLNTTDPPPFLRSEMLPCDGWLPLACVLRFTAF